MYKSYPGVLLPSAFKSTLVPLLQGLPAAASVCLVKGEAIYPYFSIFILNLSSSLGVWLHGDS